MIPRIAKTAFPNLLSFQELLLLLLLRADAASAAGSAIAHSQTHTETHKNHNAVPLNFDHWRI